jgi:acyl carrier protein
MIALRDAPAPVRWGLLNERMCSVAARVLGLDRGAPLDVNRPLQEMGLDSLMAVELRNLMKKELGLERPVAATIVFDYPTVTALAEYVGTTLFGWPAAAAGRARADVVDDGDQVDGGDAVDLLDRLENLSPLEVEQLLARRMASGD